ncbi:hypothetical protein L6164_036065 [Bauhinia variegata]|uniref:Uncharacterized protein n=1 Tax=Bauhinia variegata TaxID=167791 RepID=A0ACB9KFX2_BAUVA|nr:hypothetical protein L6164_036065 [Bauhinia variegata]
MKLVKYSFSSTTCLCTSAHTCLWFLILSLHISCCNPQTGASASSICTVSAESCSFFNSECLCLLRYEQHQSHVKGKWHRRHKDLKPNVRKLSSLN